MPDNLPFVFCAIDTPDLDRAKALAGAMAEAGCGIKLGLEFFCRHGQQGVATIRKAFPELPLFLDLKFHDIPNTVVGAVRSVTSLAPSYVTVHASGGKEMLQAAQDEANHEALIANVTAPKILAVTVLTSLNDASLEAVGQQTPADHQVLKLARLTQDAGLPGIVCAGPDIASVRASLGNDLVLMVPGIRPEGSAVGDQKRVMTPREAIGAGATHLVIGRPITAANDPAAVATDILASL
jgi:orotidine-5'-phosphate decarboxylase